MSAHEQLRTDLMRAVSSRAPARTRRRRLRLGSGARLLAVAGALLIAGGAFALTGGFSRDEISVPTHFGARQALIVARSGPTGMAWQVFLRPCGAGRFATGVSFGPAGRQAGIGYNGCQLRDATRAVSDATYEWTPGLTVIYGLARTDVRSVRVTLRRRVRDAHRRIVERPYGVVTVPTHAAPTMLLGHRIAPMRLCSLSTIHNLLFTRIEGLDAHGNVVGICPRPGCFTPPRTTR
jgi:hypothetical protein